MKTIRFTTPATWMLAGLAALIVAGTANAEEAGTARLTDMVADTAVSETELVIRGASDLRRRNAQTTQALQQMFRDDDVRQAAANRPAEQRRQPIQQIQYDACAPSACCAPDACCPPTCCAPAGCCPPGDCCPAPCCEPCCACPAGSCCCPPGDCCCPAGECCCPTTCDGYSVGHVGVGDPCMLCGGQGCLACMPSHGCQCPPGNCQCGYCQCGQGRYGYGKRGHGHGGCRICNSSSCLNNNCFAGFLSEQAVAHRARNRMASANVGNYFRCKLGYFIPTGNGGTGSPLVGAYQVVYPVDPNYFDGRDGQVYAAQGYGGAVSVPLAPVVRHAYNYGWGVPSSRLTPVSNTVP